MYLSVNDFNPRSPSGLRPLKVYTCNTCAYFNPRSPSGLRLILQFILNHYAVVFQSTQPEWAATQPNPCLPVFGPHFNPRSPSGLRRDCISETEAAVTISIHAARVGCDGLNLALITARLQFQSTQPEWAATFYIC